MKIRYISIALVTIAVTLITSCEKSDGGNDIVTTDYSLLLEAFAQNTVVATYADMKDNSTHLYDQVTKFVASGSQSDLDAACDFWKSTRAPWEAGEAFLFGPAAYNSLDPLLDSWPLDQAQLNQVLDGSQELTAGFVREGLGAVLRGFHTVEYLLFRDGQNRNAGNFTQRELEYLEAVTQVLRDDCITLWALWNGVEEGSAEAEILENLGIAVAIPYSAEFMNAGKAGSRYTAQRDAVEEIIQGIADIADEVANGKLADPYTTKDVLVVESWHSWNSLTDFRNNLQSILNAYTSSYKGITAEHSISALVAAKNAALDDEVKAKINTAITALEAIPEPYRNNLNDDSTIPTAMSAINEVFEIFDNAVRSVVLNN